MRSWPIVVPAALAAVTVVGLDVGGPFQLVVAGLFLLTCPALGYVRLLRLGDAELEVALSVGLALAIDALVSLALVAAGIYEPLLAVSLIAAIAVIGAIADGGLGAGGGGYSTGPDPTTEGAPVTSGAPTSGPQPSPVPGPGNPQPQPAPPQPGPPDPVPSD
jgi:hypothetical protein